MAVNRILTAVKKLQDPAIFTSRHREVFLPGIILT